MIKAVIFDMFETLITHYTTSLYFSTEMALDAGIPYQDFYHTWKETDSARTLGEMTFKEVIRKILIENNAWSQQKFDLIISKRTQTKKELFNKLHPQIIPMLKNLKEMGLKTALISNCFDEEAAVIKESILYPYFDITCLSCELKMHKPEAKIFEYCLKNLKIQPYECLYCGDGGSSELETTQKLGMQPLQACWYFSPATEGILTRNKNFPQLESPIDLVSFIKI
ncbi:MAG: HAD family hydrolase [Treponema sp.]|nr:HAD family hydrolase [Treponema sp.]